MGLDRQLMHSLVAAIVLLAAYLVPSAAEAHAGHHHHARAAVSAPHVNPVEPQSAITTTSAEVGTQIWVTEPAPDTPMRAKGCNGLCCGMGVACCVHALVAESGAVAPVRTAARPIRVPELALRPGVDPEALPKPPRPLA